MHVEAASTCSTATDDIKRVIKARVKSIVIGHAADRRHRYDRGTIYATLDLTAWPSKFYAASEAWVRGVL